MKLKIVLPFFVFLCTVFITPIYAQTNYANIKVDDLTDNQIRQLIQRAESIGYNDAQLEQLAAAQGMKSSEIQKLRARVEKIRKQESSSSSNKSTTTSSREIDRARKVNGLSDSTKVNKKSKTSKDELELDEEDERRLLVKDLFDDLTPKIFGSELFKNGDITFEPNMRMATPKGYVIGPDDELLIDITGDNDKDYELKVSPEGKIRLEYVGLISVGGLTIEQASSKIAKAMEPTYPALRSGRTSVAVNLGNIRSIKVMLTGSIVKPGTYTLPSLATVFNALYACGGPNESGSYRNIQVIRNNKVIATIDTYDFLLNGIQRGNVRLQDQDVIHVPVYDTRVEVQGETKRFGYFETVKGETLKDVLRFAGDFNSSAYTAKIKVLQNTSKERRISDVNDDEYAIYQPKNGDKFVVEAILDRFENRVEIEGAVFRPGQFELSKGLTLKELILKADGLREDAFKSRGYINRLNPDLSAALISFDVEKVMAGTAENVVLQREDKVTISSIFDMRDEYKVTIQGEVREPAVYDFAKSMTLQDLIQMAGGFKTGATPSRIEISRRVKNSDANSKTARTAEIFLVDVNQDLSLSEEKFVLEPFDIVSVRIAEGYTVQRQVKIEGEVLYPGTYTINHKNERISDIIKRAGGLTSVAYSDGASLKRPGPKKIKKGEEDSLGKKNKNDDSYLDSLEESDINLLNLKRLDQNNSKIKKGINDNKTVSKEDSLMEVLLDKKVLQSDLIGINLTKILQEPQANFDLVLEDGDIIRVPKLLQTVKVTGEVLNPNGIVYKSGRTLKSYINGAGGFTNMASRQNVFIRYANGTAEGVSKFLMFKSYPKVKPGAEIMVPKRLEREPMTTQAWIAISSTIASVAAILITVLRY